MNKRYFLFENGKITEYQEIIEVEGEQLYLSKVPTNFLELIDELKKISFVCHAVCVTLNENNMNICLYKRDSLEMFTKHHAHLVTVKTDLPVNERLKDFLYSLAD